MGRIRSVLGRLGREQGGAALTETIVVLPVMIVFMAGILEFSAFLYTKLQVETGLKEAARYLARCPAGEPCDDTSARRIAVYGTPDGSGNKRAWGWSDDASVIAISTWSPAAWAHSTEFDVVQVSTTFTYPGSPIIQAIGLNGLTIAARHQERVIGR
jgi:hypothetical protein